MRGEKRQQRHPVLYLTLNYYQCQGKTIATVLKIGLLLCWSIVWLEYVKLLLCYELEQTVTCDEAMHIVFK